MIGHPWGGHLAMHLAARHQDRLLGLVAVDPLGAVPDGGASDLDRILAERVPPELAARAQEPGQRAMAGEEPPGTRWKGWPSSGPGTSPHPARPANAAAEPVAGVLRRNVRSIHAHFERKTLERCLPSLRIPAVFLLGAASPVPPQHGVASAALIPGARPIIEDDCGHFRWLERPGSVRRALQSICS